jgi:hypothetical protein
MLIVQILNIRKTLDKFILEIILSSGHTSLPFGRFVVNAIDKEWFKGVLVKT